MFIVSKKVGLKVFGKFGDAFEDYASDILRRMYPQRTGLVDRVAFRLSGKDGQGQGIRNRFRGV